MTRLTVALGVAAATVLGLVSMARAVFHLRVPAGTSGPANDKALDGARRS